MAKGFNKRLKVFVLESIHKGTGFLMGGYSLVLIAGSVVDYECRREQIPFKNF